MTVTELVERGAASITNLADAVMETALAGGSLSGGELAELGKAMRAYAHAHTADTEAFDLLGTTVAICEDPNWVGVVTVVKKLADGSVSLYVEWRKDRDIIGRWMTPAEVAAYKKLEER